MRYVCVDVCACVHADMYMGMYVGEQRLTMLATFLYRSLIFLFIAIVYVHDMRVEI